MPNQKLGIEEKAVFIEHIKGYVGLGDISIIIAIACAHPQARVCGL